MRIESCGREFDGKRYYLGWQGENRAEEVELVLPRRVEGVDLLETDCVLELWDKSGFADEVPLELRGGERVRALWRPPLAVMARPGDL